MSAEDEFSKSMAPISFQRFMDLMRNEEARDLVRKINRFLHEFELAKPDPVKDSKALQHFLEKMEKEFSKHRLWKTFPVEDQIIANEGLEKYILTKLYERSFMSYTEDKERDKILSSRMSALQFITPQHLDIPDGIITTETLLIAIKELQSINGVKAPRDKLVCLLKCCKTIINLLSSAGKSSGGADIFLPILNYVVIKAQPDALISNIEFIKRFRMKTKLTSYTEYYFIQLCSAACFIETADASTFTNAKQEFLANFLQNGLISWKQYEDALQENVLLKKASLTQSSDTNLVDLDFIKPSSDDIQSSIHTDHSSLHYRINLDDIQTADDIYLEGLCALQDLVESDILETKYPFLMATASNITVEEISVLLTEYKSLVLSYELLAETIHYKDIETIFKLLSESDAGHKWKSIWPSNGVLLPKYRFWATSMKHLTFPNIVQLLNDYKLLVLRHEAVELGLKARIVNNRMSSSFHKCSSDMVLLNGDVTDHGTSIDTAQGLDHCELQSIQSDNNNYDGNNEYLELSENKLNDENSVALLNLDKLKGGINVKFEIDCNDYVRIELNVKGNVKESELIKKNESFEMLNEDHIVENKKLYEEDSDDLMKVAFKDTN